jgi:hypothetical protein
VKMWNAARAPAADLSGAGAAAAHETRSQSSDSVVD